LGKVGAHHPVEVHLDVARQVAELQSLCLFLAKFQQARVLRQHMVEEEVEHRLFLRARYLLDVVWEEEHAIKYLGVGEFLIRMHVQKNATADIFVSRVYGSGYPGITGRGVFSRGFPFYFWPIIWVGAAGGATRAYLYDSEV